MLMNLPELLRNNKQIKLKRYKPIKNSRRAEIWYKRELLLFVKQLRDEIESAVENNRTFFSSQFHDAANDDRTALLDKLNRLGEKKIDEMASRIAGGFTQRAKAQHDNDFSQRLQQATGLDLKSYIQSNPTVNDKVNQLAQANVQLIKSIHNQYLDKVQTVVHQSVLNGKLNRDLLKSLKEIGNITEKRAKLIARDQSSKFNGAIDQAQQEALGITHYIWSTSGDERVRESHAENEGKIFSWASPPPTGHPTHEVNCRCVALPYFGKDSEKLVVGLTQQPEEDRLLKGLIGATAFNFVAEHFTKILPNIAAYRLSRSEAMSVIAYTGAIHRPLNKALRTGTASAEQLALTKTLDNALKKISVHNKTTYRNIKLSKKELTAFLARYQQGAVVEEFQFTSTSKRSDLSHFKGNVKFIIHGKTGRDIEQISLYPHEREVLFQTKKRFYVRTVQQKGWFKKTYLVELIEE
ncbi:phage minor head protein [Avibacterium paragallinarum]|uniref:NAD(+)--protein-arginine ADP-ribosyltransferase n=1 Tax=Avibacterium paragallinarum TaxID=728 RepID=A0AAE5TFY0_AVIPA|nr:phage minor head protein [Avibacterium paragallinarum]MEE3609691.1 phage minor head protein [Avibacterium paragallinarum]MEE3621750.1 phage minor head protein [Avibacterium paragallinarum]MEE3669498.1 phage minor head protein [Avibacterium paragallinarum]MEE3681780.1 phage minor head protein [Avibacterium paragallinarum]MEE4387028.1 phage minor head protein [Avibacterium paragallinarum]